MSFCVVRYPSSDSSSNKSTAVEFVAPAPPYIFESFLFDLSRSSRFFLVREFE